VDDGSADYTAAIGWRAGRHDRLTVRQVEQVEETDRHPEGLALFDLDEHRRERYVGLVPYFETTS
jgi:hypothetical protein